MMNNKICEDVIVGEWSRDSWQSLPAIHIPDYDNQAALDEACITLSKRPGLVDVEQIHRLHCELEQVYYGDKFIIQIGDCAERIIDTDGDIVAKKINQLNSLAECIADKTSPLLIGRMAGQYAKPRSSQYETIDNIEMRSYFGDLINAHEPSAVARKPDANRMLLGYDASKKVLAHMHKQAGKHTIYASHEGLHLPYEAALTRELPHLSQFYNVSTHFPWLGVRTAINSPAHLEYFRGIANPLAVKVGPNMTSDDLIYLCNILNPDNVAGRLTFIHRLGAERIKKVLPGWVLNLEKANKRVIWICDPMHGNGEVTPAGIKTRYLDKIMDEIKSAFSVHHLCSSRLAGIHLEATPFDVTECVDHQAVSEDKLTDNFKSYVDPRLNFKQTLRIMQEVVLDNIV